MTSVDRSVSALIAEINLKLRGSGARLTFTPSDVAVVEVVRLNKKEVVRFYLKTGLLVFVDLDGKRVEVWRAAAEPA